MDSPAVTTSNLPTAQAYTQYEYADDVDSFLAQLRDLQAALHTVNVNLVPLLIDRADDPERAWVRPVDGGDAVGAFAHGYQAQQVDKLARAAERMAHDFHVMQDRYDAAHGATVEVR